MKRIKYYTFLMPAMIFSLLIACENGTESTKTSSPVLSISAEESGYIYLDGQYTGLKTPAEITVSKGAHVIGVAMKESTTYLRKELKVSEDAEVALTASDKPEPKVWKALWIGIHEVTGASATGRCSAHFSKEELDAGFEFFQWSIRNQFEPYSYGTIQWDVERKDIDKPVELHKASNTWFTLEPNSITDILPQVKPGNYDAVFVFWREKDGACSFQSSYFGLAWTDPLNEPIKTGYITIKFDAEDDINKKIEWYKNNDPGGWVHEWLHTVGENFFQNRGERLPEMGDDGLVIHAAEKYNYTYPWLGWYDDFIGGRVKVIGQSNAYCGIGPEAFLKKSLRELAIE